MDIVFVRHGRTNINKAGKYGGSLDSPMCLEGIEEIAKVVFLLGNTNFDCVFTSPLKRAVETTKIIGHDFVVDKRIREMDFGIFEGLNHKEVTTKYPKESKLWSEDFVNYCIPKGESLLDVYERTEEFIKDVKNKYNRILVVTHGGIIGCALSMVFGGPHQYYRFKVSHGGITIVSIEDDFMYIKALNTSNTIEELI